MDQEIYQDISLIVSIILDDWVFDSIIFTDELFAKALQRFVTCLLVTKNSCVEN